MADASASKAQRSGPNQMVGLLLTIGAIANVAFYFLSEMYFQDRASRFGPDALASLGSARVAFGVLSLVLVFGAVGVAAAPRALGHALAGATAATSVIAAIFALTSGMPIVFGVTLLVLGVVMAPMVWHSLAGSRAAWASLIAICGVLAVVLVFGAPKVRNLFGIGLWSAMILPGVLGTAAAALGALGERYRGQG
ncbi:MAG: hypothetical protein ACTHU0_07530 [Kofleriaceae bacterium]